MYATRLLVLFGILALTPITSADGAIVPVLDQAEVAAYQQNHDTLEALLQQTDNRYHKAHVAYRLAITHLNLGNKKEADQALDIVLDTLPTLLEEQPDHVEAMSILASSIGLRVAIKPYRAPFIAGDSKGWVEKALLNHPDHPLPYMIKGISLFNSPPLFGGDKQEALKMFELAQQRYENQQANIWGEPENLYWLGLNYAALNKTDLARDYLQKALDQVPEFKQAQRALERIEQSE